MNLAEWILVIFLSVALLVFLILAIVAAVKFMRLTEEAKKIVITGQSIAIKTDQVIDNVKNVTSVGGIVKTFADRFVEKQNARYAAEDAARTAAERAEAEAVAAAEIANRKAEEAAAAKAKVAEKK